MIPFDYEAKLIEHEMKLLALERRILEELGSGTEIKLSGRIKEVLALAKNDLVKLKEAEGLQVRAKAGGQENLVLYYAQEEAKFKTDFINHSKLLDHYLLEEEALLTEKIRIIKTQWKESQLAELEAKKKRKIV